MSNKFQGFFDARNPKVEPTQQADAAGIAPPVTSEEPKAVPVETAVPVPRRMGRPPGGKKSNPAYQRPYRD